MAIVSAEKSIGKKSSRRVRYLLSALIVVGLLISLHRPILRSFSRCLVVSQEVSPASDLIPWSGDHQYDLAAELFQADSTRQVLMVDWEPDRLEQFGFIKTRQLEFLEELTARGVPASALETIPGLAKDDWDAARNLSLWLKNHPQKNVTILCDEFQSGQLSLKLRRIIGPDAKRVTFHALPDRRYGTNNWWRSRTGARACALAWIGLIDTWWRGIPNKHAYKLWDPDEYEVQLKQVIHDPVRKPAPEQAAGWLPWMARWLDIGESPAQVDHILLLPGDQTVRPFVAAALVKAGLADDVIVPRNFPSPQEIDGITEPTHEVIRKILRARGLPDEKIIVLQGQSDKTTDDARAAADFLRSAPESKIAVVTSFYHTRRSRMAFRYVYPNDAGRFIFVSTPTDNFTPDNWWKSDVGTFTIASEWTKLGLYWVRYGTGVYWIVAGFSICACCAVITYRLIVKFRRKRKVAVVVAQTV